MKAKSRLSQKAIQHSPVSESNLAVHKTTDIKKNSYLKRYFKQTRTLILSIPFYLVVLLILTKVYPSQIRDFLIPNSYFPLLVTLFLANFFLLSFIFLNSRRGFLFSLLINMVLFLKLGFSFPQYYLLVLIVAFMGLESVLTLIDNK